MDIVLNRKGGVPLHDQLLAQLELKILGGGIVPGERLPSVRALARQLGLHANTVSAAYRELEAAGHVELKRGAGVFVRAGAPATLEEARGLDEMIRLALGTAFRKGYTGPSIKAAVERWLQAAPAERVVVVDPRSETIEIISHEVQSALKVPVSGCTLEELEAEPALLSGALALVYPYHADKVAGLVPGAAVETIHVELPPERQGGRARPARRGHGPLRLPLTPGPVLRGGSDRRPARRRGARGDAPARAAGRVASAPARSRPRPRRRPLDADRTARPGRSGSASCASWAKRTSSVSAGLVGHRPGRD